MSTEPSPRAEQIQANVAAALSRLRGEPASNMPQPTPPAEQKPSDYSEAGNTHGGNAQAGNDALFATEPAPSGIGAPDPGMSLGGNRDHDSQPTTAFERMTGLKPTGLGAPSHQAAGQNAAGQNAAGQNATAGGPNLDPDDQPDLLQGIGVPPPPLADLPDPDSEEARRKRRLRNRLMLGAAAVVLLGGFWILSGGDSPDGEVPVITADGAPERVKPADEGGLSVPNQDVAILNEGSDVGGSETVLPAPEQPAAPPVAETPPVEAPAENPPAIVATAPEPTTGSTDGAEVATISEAAPAIPSVSAPDVAEIPSVPAPTELGAPAAPAVVEEPAAAAVTETAAAETVPAPAAEDAAAATLPKVSAAIQPVPGGTARIQLASVKSEDGARQEWSRLQRTYPAILGGLELHVEKFEKSAGEIYYRVQAGPLGDKASAKQICADLKQKNQACIVAN